MSQSIKSDFSQIPLQKSIIYGPVNSRRLGRSLGINLLSTQKKICSFDCLYCQYGFTRLRSTELNDKKNFASPGKVVDELTDTLHSLQPKPDYITFSGNGEATLHPQFGLIVDHVVRIRDQLAPQARTAILSNSSLVINKKICESLAKLDDRIMKLDCGSHEVFHRYNRPPCDITLEDIISNLAEMHDITIQSLFTKGKLGNYFEPHIRDWIDAIIQINPVYVQLYSLDRGVPSTHIEHVPKQDLVKLKKALNNEGIEAGVY